MGPGNGLERLGNCPERILQCCFFFWEIVMSVLDKVIAAVTPPESEEARLEARAKARKAATPGGWLEMVLNHHLEIEAAFKAVKDAQTSESRRVAQKNLAVILTGHSIAEESVLYPALALNDAKAHAETAYFEQSATKIQMAALDDLDPMSQDYMDKLEHIEGAVAHHVYEEEGDYFLDLQSKLPAVKKSKMTKMYAEEFERYVGAAAK
jgi:hypothetical protein